MPTDVADTAKRSWRLAADWGMLCSLAYLFFWAGDLSRKVEDLHFNALTRKSEISTEVAERISKVEARQTDVIGRLDRVEQQLDRMEDRQEKILEQIKSK